MTRFKIALTAAAALSAAFATAGAAYADDGPTYSGNIAIATDYAFRGISQTDGAPAVQGGFDVAVGQFYAGAWASNVDFGEFGVSGNLELDLYGGVKFDLSPITLDLGVIGYLYPSSSDIPGPTPASEGELDYLEGYAKASFAPTEKTSVTGALFVSPEFTGETGEAYYAEISGSAALSDVFSLSGGVGYQSIDDVSGVFPGSFSDEYTTWNLGGTLTVAGFALDLRYVDTDIDNTDPIIAQAFTSADRVEERVIFSIKRAL
jgi:uncharacterized protein (TIGR02001 family)